MIYELNTDEFYAYGCLYEPWSRANTELYLSDEVDEELLNAAVSAAFEKMPYFKVKHAAARQPERYVLVTNDAEFRAVRSRGFIPFDSEQANAYLITVSFFEKQLRVCFSHALSDGVGISRFLTEMLMTYFTLKYGPQEAAPPAPACPPEKEYANPFDYLPERGHWVERERTESFSFSDDDIFPDRTVLSCLSVPEGALLKYSKESESSVAAVAAWILMNGILNVRGEGALPLGVTLPFNMRGVLGCPENTRNCNSDLELTMTQKLRAHDDAYQLSCLRGQMFLQTYEGCCLPLMARSKQKWLEASHIDGIEERCRFYSQADGLSMKPIVTYVGKLDFGPYHRYCERIVQYLKVTGTAGILMLVLSEGGSFRFCITGTLKNWDEYLKAITDFLDRIGIPYSLDEPLRILE